MSWVCPYEINAHCKRLKKFCQPGIKGCILSRRVRFLDIADEDSLPKGKKKDRVDEDEGSA